MSVRFEAKGGAGRIADRRGWLELAALLAGGCVFFGVASVSLIATVRDERTASAWSTTTGIALGAVVALGMTATVAWGWRRDGGRAAQRLGRRAWRAGRLPDGWSDRVVALRDLERRRRLLERRMPQIVAAAGWGVLAALQIALHPSLLTALLWGTLFASNAVVGVQDLLDRRHLPELHALLAEDRVPEAPVGV